MDSLRRFFLPKKILKFKKGRKKIGLWIPLFVFFSNQKMDFLFFKKTMVLSKEVGKQYFRVTDK